MLLRGPKPELLVWEYWSETREASRKSKSAACEMTTARHWACSLGTKGFDMQGNLHTPATEVLQANYDEGKEIHLASLVEQVTLKSPCLTIQW